MIVLDTFENNDDAAYLKDLLAKNGISFTEKTVDAGLQILIDEADENKLNEVIKNLD
jgi:hypothetical protein